MPCIFCIAVQIITDIAIFTPGLETLLNDLKNSNNQIEIDSAPNKWLPKPSFLAAVKESDAEVNVANRDANILLTPTEKLQTVPDVSENVQVLSNVTLAYDDRHIPGTPKRLTEFPAENIQPINPGSLKRKTRDTTIDDEEVTPGWI